MPLSVGTRLGVYEVTGTLGAGGMGEVYRARDPRLQRDVALKILPDADARAAERLARFARVAQMLAAPNHLYSVGGLWRDSNARAWLTRRKRWLVPVPREQVTQSIEVVVNWPAMLPR